MKKFVAELVGTMFLVLLACGSAVLAGPSISTLGIGLCFGLVLICLCYAIGGISGCHVNPAVSLGVFLTNKDFSAKDLVSYWVAQFIGAAIGGLLLYWLLQLADAPPHRRLYGGGQNSGCIMLRRFIHKSMLALILRLRASVTSRVSSGERSGRDAMKRLASASIGAEE